MEDKNINVNISKNRRRYSISPTNLLFRVLDRNADLSEIKFWDFKKQLTFRVLLIWMAVIVLAIGLFNALVPYFSSKALFFSSYVEILLAILNPLTY